MAFDIEGARKEGYSDADIAGYLAKQRKFDLAGARKEGYSDADVIAHLTKSTPKFEPRAATPADIPGAVPQPTPPMAADRGILDYIVGGPEAALSAVTGLAAVPIAAGAGILTGKMGQPNQDVTGRVMRGIQYQPRTQTGQDILTGVGNAAEFLKVPPIITEGLNLQGLKPAANALRNEIQMAREFQPFPERAARLQQERVTKSFQDAPLIESAQAAQRLGVAIPPSISNPTKGNKIVAALTGSPEAKMARGNELQWTEAAKKDMGLTPNTTLNQQGFESAKSNPNIVKPYDTVRKLGLMVADEADIRDIKDLQKQAFIGGKSSADAVASVIDDAIQRVSAGMNGEELLREVQNIRQRANEIYTAQRKGVTPPSPESIAVAKASDALANKLEDIAATNLTGTEARAFQNARTSLAKIYDYERATDVRTGRLDPIKFAKITEGKQTTGTAADIANVAANFPSIAEVKPGAWTQYISPLARGGTAGTLGFGLGSLVGFPAAGGVIGATGGMLANALMARRMSSPAYQAAHAMPPDYRPPINALRPVEPGSSNLAIFNPQNAVLPPEYTPNFTMPGQGQPQPRSAYEAAQRAQQEAGLRRTGSLGPDMQFAAPRELPMPGAEGPVQERIYNYARDKAAAEAAEAAAAKSAGARQSAGAGVSYELDPFTGKLQPVGQQVKGPETFTPLQENVMMRDLKYVEQLKEELNNLKGSKNKTKQNKIKKQIQEIEFFYADKIPNFLVKRGRNQDYGSSESFTPPSGLRNITPQSGSSVVSAQQTTLDSAIEKLKRGAAATLTAEEKIILRSLQNQNQLAP